MKFIALCLGLVLAFGCYASPAYAVGVGSTAPSFRVVSADGKVMTSGQMRGKVVVIFYTSRKSRDINEQLADTLQQCLYEQPANVKGQVLPLPIIDSSEANLATKSFWQFEMKKVSQHRGMTVYGDWDGQMRNSWNIAANKSNLIIVDKNGVVRYQYTGPIPRSEYQPIIDLLLKLVNGASGS